MSIDVFAKLKELNFPQGEYVVVGGAVTAHNIRPSQDLDILVTEKFYKDLQEQGWEQCHCDQCIEQNRILTHKEGEDVDILPNLILGNYKGDTAELIKNADIINGFPFIKLAELIKFKRELGRDKDFADIKLIEEYLKKY